MISIRAAIFRSILAMNCFLAVAGFSCGASAEEKPFYRDAVNETGAYSCLSRDESELFRLINEYRESSGLPPLRNSRSLTKVARIHAMDLALNRPEKGVDADGQQCNLHSWSDRGFWSGVCYTPDHRYSEKMWNKAREITSYVYPGDVVENVYLTSEKTVDVRRALEGWKKSPSHNALMLESGPWKESNLLSLGVGIYNNVAIMWVGTLIDPAGDLPVCAPGR